MKIVVLGGVAGGVKLASRLMRVQPDLDITVVEKQPYLSYVETGLSLVVGNTVRDSDALRQTTWKLARTPEWLENVKKFKTLPEHEVQAIDKDNKVVKVLDLNTQEEKELTYDKLVLASGSYTEKPDMGNIDAEGVFVLDKFIQAEEIQDDLKTGASTAIIWEPDTDDMRMAEAIANWGLDVHIVTEHKNILAGTLEPEMSVMFSRYLVEDEDLMITTEAKVDKILVDENGRVSGLETSQGTIEGDLLFIGGRRKPCLCDAEKAGVEIGESIVIDEYGETSVKDIFAVGTCAEVDDKIAGKKRYLYNGNLEIRHGYAVAPNLLEEKSRAFRGVVNARLVKVFDWFAGGVGYTEEEAKRQGFEPVSALFASPDASIFMPVKGKLILRVIADKNTKKVLGVQGVGPGGVDKRLDAAAAAMLMNPDLTLADLEDLDVCYEPAVARPIDILMAAAHITENAIDGISKPMGFYEALTYMNTDGAVFLDVRIADEIASETPLNVENKAEITLEEIKKGNVDLPKDKLIIPFCTISTRGFEAQLALEALGYQSRYLEGGVEFWPLDAYLEG